MVEEEKEEKKVEVKEKSLGGTKKVEQTEQRVSEQPPPAAQRGRAENVASKGGEVIGKGLKKVAGVVEGFTSGVSKETKAGGPPRQGQQTEYRSEQTERAQEATQGKVVEKEKVEKKVTKEKE